MGQFVRKTKMKQVTLATVGLLAVSLCMVHADWSGSGELICYSHYESSATFPEGAGNEAPATVRCTPQEWKYPEVDLGPEAMFFHPNNGDDFEIWAWDYHDGQDSIPYADCDGDFWYKMDDMGAGFCTPNGINGITACGVAHCTGNIKCYGCWMFIRRKSKIII